MFHVNVYYKKNPTTIKKQQQLTTDNNFLYALIWMSTSNALTKATI